MATKAAAELLQEQRGAVGRAEHQERVHGGDVDALVEQVDREDDVDTALGEVDECPASLGVGRVGPDGRRHDAGLMKRVRHEARVLDADAEAERAHPGGVVHAPRELLEDESGPGVAAGEEVGELLHVVAAAPPPGNVAQVEAIVDAVVGEGHEAMLVDGVPESQLGGDAPVEPAEDGQSVASLGGRGEAEELARPHVVEQRAIRRGGGVVELVDDDHVEVIRGEVGEAGGAQALDRGEDVLEGARTLAADPELAERVVAEGLAERGQALGQDLFSVRHEEEPGSRKRLTKARVVERRHHRLAGARRGDEEVLVVTLLAREGDLLEQSLLERLRAKLGGAQHDDRAPGAGGGGSLVELRALVGHEVAAVPVALEDRGHLVDDAAVARLGSANVPFEAADLRRVREVRRADVRGREARLAVEEPGLGVKAGGGRVVRDAHVGSELGELVEGAALGRARVRGRQDPQLAAGVAVRAQGGEQRRDSAATNERHHHVDAIGGVDLGEDLVADPRLAWGVGEERRVEQRNERLGDRFGAPVGKAGQECVKDLGGVNRALERKIGCVDCRGRAADGVDQGAGERCAISNALPLAKGGNSALEDAVEVQRNAVGSFSRAKRGA